MWIFCKAGFFSAVEKGTEGKVCIRGRVAEDFDRLRALYYPKLDPVSTGGGTDYPYRVYVSRETWSEICRAIGQDVDYSNFKSWVAAAQGYERAHLYGDVWAVMHGAEDALPKK